MTQASSPSAPPSAAPATNGSAKPPQGAVAGQELQPTGAPTEKKPGQPDGSQESQTPTITPKDAIAAIASQPTAPQQLEALAHLSEDVEGQKIVETMGQAFNNSKLKDLLTVSDQDRADVESQLRPALEKAARDAGDPTDTEEFNQIVKDAVESQIANLNLARGIALADRIAKDPEFAKQVGAQHQPPLTPEELANDPLVAEVKKANIEQTLADAAKTEPALQELTDAVSSGDSEAVKRVVESKGFKALLAKKPWLSILILSMLLMVSAGAAAPIGVALLPAAPGLAGFILGANVLVFSPLASIGGLAMVGAGARGEFLAGEAVYRHFRPAKEGHGEEHAAAPAEGQKSEGDTKAEQAVVTPVADTTAAGSSGSSAPSAPPSSGGSAAA